MKAQEAKRCGDCPLRSHDNTGRYCAGPLQVTLRPYLMHPDHTRDAVGPLEKHKVCGVGVRDKRSARVRMVDFVSTHAVRLGRAYHNAHRGEEYSYDLIQSEAVLLGPLALMTTAVYFLDFMKRPKDVERITYFDASNVRQDFALSKKPVAIDYTNPY